MRGTKNILVIARAKELVIAGLKILVIAGLTGNLLSCSKPQEQEAAFVPVPDMSAPIEFSEQIAEPQTKGLDPITDPVYGIYQQHFGIYSWWNPIEEVFDELNNPANIYQSNNDVQFVENISSSIRKWKCNPTAYWPFACNLSFFAYAPYQHTEPYMVGDELMQPELVFPSNDYTQGMPRATYTPRTRVRNQVDFCLAPPVFDREPSNEPIHFAFQHALTRILLYVNVVGTRLPYTQYRITDAIISNVVGTNTFTYVDNSSDPSIPPFVWDPVTSSTPHDGEYHLTYTNTELNSSWVKFVSDLTTETGTDRYTWINAPDPGRLYLLPQELSDATLELAISTYRESGGSYTLSSILPPFRMTIPTAQSWEAGKAVAYLVTLDLTNLTVAGIKAMLVDWNDSVNAHPNQIIY